MNQLMDVFDELQTQARKDGAQVELSLSKSESFSAAYKMKNLHKYAFHESQSAGLRVLVGKAAGFYSTEKVDRESLLSGYQAALQTARELNKGKSASDLELELAGPMEKKELEGMFVADAMNMPVEERLNKARELEGVALDRDPRIKNVPYSAFSSGLGEYWLLNSRGQKLSSRQSSASGYLYPMAEENGSAEMDGQFDFVRDPRKFDARTVAEKAVDKCLRLLGGRAPATKKWPVVISSKVASDLLGMIAGDFSAKAVDEGTSLLKNKKGLDLFSKVLTLVDDPLLTELPGAREFDAEGFAARRTPLVEKGVLKNYLTDSYHARKMGLPHTASAARGSGEMDIASSNIVVETGSRSLVDLFTSAPEVIYLVKVDALHSGYKDGTGDFSLPAKGLLIQNGNIVAPLSQFVVSGNILDILARVQDVSNRWSDDRGSVRSPDLLVDGVSIAGG